MIFLFGDRGLVMVRICLMLITLMVSVALFAGCSDKAKELYETARLEE